MMSLRGHIRSLMEPDGVQSTHTAKAKIIDIIIPIIVYNIIVAIILIHQEMIFQL